VKSTKKEEKKEKKSTFPEHSKETKPESSNQKKEPMIAMRFLDSIPIRAFLLYILIINFLFLANVAVNFALHVNDGGVRFLLYLNGMALVLSLNIDQPTVTNFLRNIFKVAAERKISAEQKELIIKKAIWQLSGFVSDLQKSIASGAPNPLDTENAVPKLRLVDSVSARRFAGFNAWLYVTFLTNVRFVFEGDIANNFLLVWNNGPVRFAVYSIVLMIVMLNEVPRPGIYSFISKMILIIVDKMKTPEEKVAKATEYLWELIGFYTHVPQIIVPDSECIESSSLNRPSPSSISDTMVKQIPPSISNTLPNIIPSSLAVPPVPPRK
jgi:hypothetical protein